MTQINAFTYFDQYMKYYDEPTHHFKYVIAPSDSLLNSDGLAYAMWPQYADWTAVQSGIPNTGSVDIPVTRTFDPLTGDYDGWNLVGNPFTSAVDLSLILLAGLSTNLDPTAWFWDPQSGNYTVFPLGGGGSHSQYCPAGQGFFIHCSDLNATPASPGSGNVHMVSSARLHNTESFLKETKANILKVTVTGSPNAFRDEMSIYFDDARASEYEPGFDAEKIEGSPEAPQLWSVSENIDLAVNALSFTGQTMIVPVWFKAGHPGSYRLLFSELESFNHSTGIYLEDFAEGITRDLRADPEYIFSHSPGNPPERFAVRFTKESIGIPVPDQGQSLRIFAAGGRITIESPSAAGLHGRIDIYDLLGRSVSSATAGGQQQVALDAPVSTGYLVVRVVEPERTTVRKIYMK
jgi:hypothetical protein